MKRIRKDIEISNLIYKSLRGETSKDEDELLEAWCLESRNRKLFLELQEADHLYEGITDMYNVDTNVPLKKVNDKIKKKYTYSCCVLCSDPYFCHDTGLPYFLGYLLQSENTG